jgi:hypothetical protein
MGKGAILDLGLVLGPTEGAVSLTISLVALFGRREPSGHQPKINEPGAEELAWR